MKKKEKKIKKKKHTEEHSNNYMGAGVIKASYTSDKHPNDGSGDC